MKILNSTPISSFGGINYVLKEIEDQGIGLYLNRNLPNLAKQSRFSWKDIIYSYWSVFFCGGNCAEDLSKNLHTALKDNPFLNLPSPDRILERLKSLSTPHIKAKTSRSTKIHQLSPNSCLNQLNIGLLKKLRLIPTDNNTLDYDNTFVFAEKADSAYTYKQRNGYCPGVGLIGNNIVYVENRNGNSNPEALQLETLKRMFDLLTKNKIHVSAFRADAASYSVLIINEIQKHVDKFYIRARMSEVLDEAIKNIDTWKEMVIDGKICYRGSVKFTPFKRQARSLKNKQILKEYRLVVTKEKRDDGQINLFTGEAFNYRGIITNDLEMTDDKVVIFYNQRGTEEREFDVLKNDFGWNNMPFSSLEQNNVFLIITAMCRNLYNYIIKKFSQLYKYLKPNYRIKKFIFRFICVPAKWIRSSRQWKLRIYGHIAYKT